MSVTDFDHGYWYATELKEFAKQVEIPSAARLRKDQLEHAIRKFLRSGTIPRSANGHPAASSRSQVRDVDLGLHLDRRVVRYTNDVTTKEFLTREATKLVPNFRQRSGAKYRLNRWREEQLRRGVELTYRDVVEEYVRLSRSAERFAQIPHGRYINFMSSFLAREAGATRRAAIEAWHRLKTMDCRKSYRGWLRARRAKP